METDTLFFLLLFLVLRILFIYWEFTVVLEDCGIGEALSRSREHFRNRIPETVSVIFTIIGLNAGFALLVNALWNPIAFVIFILIYGYIATGIQLALMLTLHKIYERGQL